MLHCIRSICSPATNSNGIAAEHLTPAITSGWKQPLVCYRLLLLWYSTLLQQPFAHSARKGRPQDYLGVFGPPPRTQPGTPGHIFSERYECLFELQFSLHKSAPNHPSKGLDPAKMSKCPFEHGQFFSKYHHTHPPPKRIIPKYVKMILWWVFPNIATLPTRSTLDPLIVHWEAVADQNPQHKPAEHAKAKPKPDG